MKSNKFITWKETFHISEIHVYYVFRCILRINQIFMHFETYQYFNNFPMIPKKYFIQKLLLWLLFVFRIYWTFHFITTFFIFHVFLFEVFEK